MLFPLSAFHAANKAAPTAYRAIWEEGTQKSVVPLMQTRAELYEQLNYDWYERQIDIAGASESPRGGGAQGKD